jgi:hypothetical protein
MSTVASGLPSCRWKLRRPTRPICRSAGFLRDVRSSPLTRAQQWARLHSPSVCASPSLPDIEAPSGVGVFIAKACASPRVLPAPGFSGLFSAVPLPSGPRNVAWGRAACVVVHAAHLRGQG